MAVVRRLVVLLLLFPTDTAKNIVYPFLRRERSAEDLGLVRNIEVQTANESITPSINVNIPKNYNVRVALLFPRDSPLLTPRFGYSTSAGAISLALERIKREEILPGANWSFFVRNTECIENVAAGVGIELLSKKQVDVVIGPPCAVTAIVIAVMAKYYDIAQISWAATSTDMANAERFPTLARVIGSSIRLGRGLKEILLYFNWKRVALIYTDDRATRKCYSIAEGLRKVLAKAGIVNVYNLGIDSPTAPDKDLDKFLKYLPDFARIVLVCLEHEGDTRRFMLRAHKSGLTSKEYVYILPDYVRDENRTELWKQYGVTNENMDERDVEAKEAFKPVLFLEMMLSGSEELHYFKKQVIQKIRGYPFYYDSEKKLDQQYGSMYSPFLHDSLYLYALALNKTLRTGGKISEGSWVMNGTKNTQFLGVSGHVVIDDTASREPSFVIRGFDNNMRLIHFAEALMYKADGKTVNLLIPERMMWETRGGFVPVDIPKCGFYNEKCKKEEKSIASYLIIGGICMAFILALLVTVAIAYVRRKLVTSEMAKMLWKITYRDIVFLNDKSRRSKSLGSLRTISTTASDETAEAIAKGEKNVAHYKGVLVWAKQHQSSMVLSGDSDHIHMKLLRDITHENLNQFIGLCVDAPHPISVWRYNSKGSLEDVLHNENVKLDWFFKYSLLKDLVSGMEYLHESELHSHGRLRSSNCVVDSRFVLKVADFGLFKMRSPLKVAKDKLWTAPEFLRQSDPSSEGSQKGDVYGFAIIVQEVIMRDRPFSVENMSPEEVIPRVAKCETPPFRPAISNETDTDSAMIQLMNDCWKEDPNLRPDFKQIRACVRQMGRGKTVNLMDHVLKMMEKYAGNLEQTVTDRTKQLTDEMKKSDLLLYRMLPRSVADALKSGRSVDPEDFEFVTLMQSDIVGFTNITTRSSPLQVVVLLNDLFTTLDDIIAEYDVYKVETIGDAYLCGSGFPQRNGKKNVTEICDMSLQFISAVKQFYIPHLPNEKLQLRIGAHTGSITAGVVGSTMPRYCIFGDTVTIAARLEETGKASCIQISEEAQKHLMEVGGYILKPRGEIIIKGKGVTFTYWVLGKSNNNIADRTGGDTTSGASGATDSGLQTMARSEAESDVTKKTGLSSTVKGSSSSSTSVASEKKKKRIKKKAKSHQVEPQEEENAESEPEQNSSEAPQNPEEHELDE